MRGRDVRGGKEWGGLRVCVRVHVRVLGVSSGVEIK